MEKISKKIISLIVLTVLAINLVLPAPAAARGFFRDVFRGLKRTTKFVVSIPDRTTRWMGPVLGPIASIVLTQNIIKNPNIGRIFRDAQRAQRIIQDVDGQKKVLAEVQKAYRDQAMQLTQRAAALRQSREQLRQQFLEDLNLQNYMKNVANLDKLIEIHEQAAAAINKAADRIGVKEIIKMVSGNAVKNTFGNIKNAVIYQANDEVIKLVDPQIIKRFTQAGGFSLDNLVDMLVKGDIDRILRDGNFGDIDTKELTTRVRDKIKEILKNDSTALRGNWREKVNEVVNDMIKDLKNLRTQLDNLNAASNLNLNVNANSDINGNANINMNANANTNINLNVNPETNQAADVDTAACKKANGGCACGYRFDPRSGVGCVQADCGKPEFSHLSYEGYCVCGSSGSINENPKDPNKECGYGSDYLACPGCVYACVKFDEDCPPLPNK